MRPDGDVTILLTADPRRGLWANRVGSKVTKAIRHGGQLQTTASRHTLLAVALSSGLRSISRSQAKLMASWTTKGRARVNVLTDDQTFADAINDMRSDAINERRTLRAGRNFVDGLKHQLARFEVRIMLADDEGDAKTLEQIRSWTRKHLIESKTLANVSPVLRPSVVSAAE